MKSKLNELISIDMQNILNDFKKTERAGDDVLENHNRLLERLTNVIRDIKDTIIEMSYKKNNAFVYFNALLNRLNQYHPKEIENVIHFMSQCKMVVIRYDSNYEDIEYVALRIYRMDIPSLTQGEEQSERQYC